MDKHFHTVIIGGGRVSVCKNFPIDRFHNRRFVSVVCPVMFPLASN
ncbi:MAG: hypothetical protein Kow0060_18000 [Methylohalobius crimeensis]